MAKMAKAHTIAYAAVRAAGLGDTRIGVAHNVRETSRAGSKEFALSTATAAIIAHRNGGQQ